MDYKFLDNSDDLLFIPLGGSEQFGMNLNVYSYGGDMLAVDCGLGFADERLPGVDIILPDPEFLVHNRDALKGMIITHAHEDHIGAVAHLWKRFKCPLYASPFTAKILAKKLAEKNLNKVKITVVQNLEEVQIGAFKVQFVPVSHSVPDSCALVVKTPHGNVLHSGDWNLDRAPVMGEMTEPLTFKALGDEGILAYVGDSTNAQTNGYAGSETDVALGLVELFKTIKTGRIVVTAFASNVGRVRSIAKAAQACGRDVGVIGRSFHNMVGVARDLGYMDGVPEFLDEEDIGFLPEERVVVIVTGSQGEARAALARVARGDHRSMAISKGDTVVFSARAIPGNEKDINHVQNNLVAAGVRVVTPKDTEHLIHVSGHPCRDEIAQMYQWLRPTTVVPVHGERTQLDAQAVFAKDCQIKNVVVPNNGSVIRLAPGVPEILDHVETGVLAVEQKRIVKTSHSSYSERRKLQFSGVVHVSLVLDARGEMLADPKLHMVGLVDDRFEGEQDIEDSLYNEIVDVVEDMKRDDLMDDHFVEEEVRIAVRRFCHHMLRFKPKTTVHVVRV